MTRDSRARTPQPFSSILPPPVHLERPRLRALPHPPHRPSNKLRIREPPRRISTNWSSTRRPASSGSITPLYRRTTAYISGPLSKLAPDGRFMRQTQDAFPRVPEATRGVPGCLASMFRDLGLAGQPGVRACSRVTLSRVMERAARNAACVHRGHVPPRGICRPLAVSQTTVSAPRPGNSGTRAAGQESMAARLSFGSPATSRALPPP